MSAHQRWVNSVQQTFYIDCTFLAIHFTVLIILILWKSFLAVCAKSLENFWERFYSQYIDKSEQDNIMDVGGQQAGNQRPEWNVLRPLDRTNRNMHEEEYAAEIHEIRESHERRHPIEFDQPEINQSNKSLEIEISVQKQFDCPIKNQMNHNQGLLKKLGAIRRNAGQGPPNQQSSMHRFTVKFHEGLHKEQLKEMLPTDELDNAKTLDNTFRKYGQTKLLLADTMSQLKSTLPPPIGSTTTSFIDGYVANQVWCVVTLSTPDFLNILA